MKPSVLAGKLWRVSLLRGLVALALGAYVLSRAVSSPVTLAWIVAVYWLFEGLVALWASRFAASLATTRGFLVVRGVVGLGAAVMLLFLPLADVFGPWKPGQTMLFIFTLVAVLAATCLQIVLTAAVDLLIGLEVRLRIPGEWSIALGAAVSILLSGLLAAGFVGFSPLPERLFGAVGVVGGLALIAGALRLRSFA